MKNSIIKYYKLAGLYFLKFFKKYWLIATMAAVTLVALIVRYVFVLFPTGDSVNFMVATDEYSWMSQIDNLGFINFFRIDSDYSPLFLFMLAILSLFPKGKIVNIDNFGYTFYENRMIYLKTVLTLFIIACAFGVFLLVKELTKDKRKACLAYVLATILPSFFVNSALWGNADIIYVTFLVYAFYFAIKGDSIWTFVFFGLALANKLQAIFIIPFLIYLLFKRKLKLWTVVLAPATYIATFIPAFICAIFGHSNIGDAFVYLSRQFAGQSNLTYGAATIWKFLEFDFISQTLMDFAPWIAILGIGGVLALVVIRNPKIENQQDMFKVGIFLTMVTIFLLPRLHERYFLLIDILLIAYAFIDKKKIYLVPVMQVSSAIVYYHYMARYNKYLFDYMGEDVVTIASLINLFIIIVLGYDVMKLEHKPLEEEVKEIEEEINNLNPKENETEKDLSK